MDPALEAELRAMLDREAITGLIHAYCRAVDRKDVAACRELYHPDALDDHGSYYQGDAAGYLDRLPEIMAPVVMMQHHITTVNIKLDGDFAESEAYGLAIHQLQGADGLEDLLVGTRFFDKFERREKKWKILHRGHAQVIGILPRQNVAVSEVAADPRFNGFWILYPLESVMVAAFVPARSRTLRISSSRIASGSWAVSAVFTTAPAK